eukprot:TRINITY_DN13416_c0_g1_i3.p1 TRINITY_DN13416_c0_g1~~TRINITY_DN13416_c0_g1_i3.p1  ORF type:complete len:105 (-),score=40.51 TRINITY_DN13416_c0_g1_i3:39-353(-)
MCIRDRYYTKRVQLSGSHSATLIFLDSSPCVNEYRSTQQGGWDPCGSEYPTCSLSGGKDDFEGPCLFHEQIVAQDLSLIHISEPTRLLSISYAVFCLKKKKKKS